jgi:lactate dehydrogenase-like 2-hydroxyacid dehydrogenase
MTLRELGAAERYLRAGQWLTAPYPLTRATLRDRRVGVLGLGRIGKAIATRLVAFGCPIHYFGRTRQIDVPYTYHDDLVAMARAVDVLVNVAPGGAATRHLINARVLEALGPEGVLINVGRGTTVDEAALIDALERGVIWSAGLDVFEDEPRVPPALIAHERVCLLPHVASASVHTRNAMGQLVVDNVLGWLNGRRVLTPVPEAMPPRSA